MPEYPQRRAAAWYERYREIMLDEKWWIDYFRRQRLAKGAGPALKMIDLSIEAKGENAVYLMKKADLVAAGMTELELKKAYGYCGGMIYQGRAVKVSGCFDSRFH